MQGCNPQRRAVKHTASEPEPRSGCQPGRGFLFGGFGAGVCPAENPRSAQREDSGACGTYVFFCIDGGKRRRDSSRSMWRGRFVFQIEGVAERRVEIAGSEWWVMRALRDISARGQQLAWFESAGAPLTHRSLAALNCYLRTRAIRFWASRRWDGDRELIGHLEWARFCRMLGLRFEGKGTRQVAA